MKAEKLSAAKLSTPCFGLWMPVTTHRSLRRGSIKKRPPRGPFTTIAGRAKSCYYRSIELPKFQRTPNSKNERTLENRKLLLLGTRVSCAKIAARFVRI